jgi:anaerobic C4-dicarboxylate transporter DcuB
VRDSLAEVVKTKPWTYAASLLIISKLVNSQAAAISALVPMALSIGVSTGQVAAFAAASYGYYILPTHPSDLATIQFDRSGTTRIGKYVINHSFILPGLIGVITSCTVGYLLARTRGLL